MRWKASDGAAILVGVTSDLSKTEPASLETRRLEFLAQELHRRGTPAETVRAYQGAWNRFHRWCQKLGRASLPCSIDTAILYLTHLADPERPREDDHHHGGACRVSTIDQAMAAICYVHRIEGLVPPRESRFVREHLKKVHVALRSPKKQAAPLLVEHLKLISSSLTHLDPVDQRDRAVLLVGWAAAMRRSEISCL
ncbi:MAG: hypothetical protein WC803_13520, partial [Sphingomonas sp.]